MLNKLMVAIVLVMVPAVAAGQTQAEQDKRRFDMMLACQMANVDSPECNRWRAEIEVRKREEARAEQARKDAARRKEQERQDRIRQAALKAEGERTRQIDALAISDEQKAVLKGHHLFIGASTEMARLAIGAPDRTRRVTTASKVTEYWYYRQNVMLYFENGRLAAIED